MAYYSHNNPYAAPNYNAASTLNYAYSPYDTPLNTTVPASTTLPRFSRQTSTPADTTNPNCIPISIGSTFSKEAVKSEPTFSTTFNASPSGSSGNYQTRGGYQGASPKGRGGGGSHRPPRGGSGGHFCSSPGRGSDRIVKNFKRPYYRVPQNVKTIWLKDRLKLKVVSGTPEEIGFSLVDQHLYDTRRYSVGMPMYLCSQAEYKIGTEMEAVVWQVKTRAGEYSKRILVTDCFDSIDYFEGEAMPLHLKAQPGFSFRAIIADHDTVNHEIKADYFGMRKIILNSPQCNTRLVGNWLRIKTVEIQSGEIHWIAQDFPGFEHLYKKDLVTNVQKDTKYTK